MPFELDDVEIFGDWEMSPVVSLKDGRSFIIGDNGWADVSPAIVFAKSAVMSRDVWLARFADRIADDLLATAGRWS